MVQGLDYKPIKYPLKLGTWRPRPRSCPKRPTSSLLDFVINYLLITESVTISFVDTYSKLKTNLIREITEEEIAELSRLIGKTAKEYGLTVKACCEKADLTMYGINRASCIDSILTRIVSYTIKWAPLVWKGIMMGLIIHYVFNMLPYNGFCFSFISLTIIVYSCSISLTTYVNIS